MSNGIGRVWAVNAEGGDEGRPNGVGPVYIENADQLGSKLPEPAAGDAGKVLGVLNSSGDIGWVGDQSGTLTQVQSNWNEDDSSQVSYIQNKPSIPAAQVQSDWNQTNDQAVDFIKNKPTIPAAQVNSDWNASSGVAQILNKPDLSVYATQSDLNGKQDTLTAGSNISISNNTISATDTTYTAGTGLSLTGTTFAADTTVLATKSDLSGKQDTLMFSNPLKNVSNTVSLVFDTDTLSASTTSESTVATFRGAYEGGVYIPILSFMDQGDVGESLDQGTPYSSITVHIPGNTFAFSWFDTSSRAAGLELGVTRTFNNSSEAVRYLTPVSVTEDQNTGYMVVDEQDVVLPMPASNSTYWTTKDFNFLSSATRYLVFARYDIGSTSVSNQFARLVDNTVEPVVTMSTSVTTAGPLTVKNPIPSVTSGDNGKVLKATYEGGVGSFGWDNAPTELPATLGTAGQVLTVNSGATGVEWVAPTEYTMVYNTTPAGGSMDGTPWNALNAGKRIGVVVPYSAFSGSLAAGSVYTSGKIYMPLASVVDRSSGEFRWNFYLYDGANKWSLALTCEEDEWSWGTPNVVAG